MPETQLWYTLCDIDLLVVRHKSKNLLALLNHSLWGVHIADINQSFTSWSVHITGRNWAFSSAVEKSSRHCPGTEYQHKQGHTSNILCRIQKNYLCSAALKFAEISHYNKGSNNGTNGKTIVRWLSYQPPIASEPYWWSQFQQGMVQEIIQKLGPTQIVLFEL